MLEQKLEQKQERAAALPREAEKKAIKALQKELAALQQPLRAAGVPVLLVFEGWSAAGKGSMIAKVISEMDPRGYQVYSAAEPTDEEARRPLLWPFWRDLPPRGEAAVLDRSWYGRVLEQMEAEHGRAGALLESVNIFERQLGDDGYLILKFFLHISQAEQKKRLEKLSGDPATAWRVTGTGGATGTTGGIWRPPTCCWRPPTRPTPPGMSSGTRRRGRGLWRC